MAILGEIRKKTWLIFVVIGVAMVAFVAGDLFGENSRIRQLFTGDPNEVGNINGESINLSEYNNAYDATSKMYQNQGQNLTANQIAQQTWSSLISQKIVLQHAEKLGLSVSDDEFWNYVAQSFGMSSATEAQQQIAQLESMASTNPEMAESYRGWLQNAEQIKLELLSQKYFGYVMAGTAVTGKEADIQQTFNISNANINYAFVAYDALVKKLNVKISDEEILAYEKKFPKKFHAEALVKLAYTFFPASASTQDDQVALVNIKKYLTTSIRHDEVNNVTDTITGFGVAKNDSIYVTQNSEQPFIANYFTKEELAQSQLTPEVNNFFNTASVGQVGGPYKIGNTYQLYKISKAKEIKDSVQSSHILVAYKGSAAQGATRSKEEAKKLADEYLKEAKANPSAFGTLAQTKSDDKGSAAQNGSIGWVGKQNGLDQSYSGFIFSKPVGTIDIVESQFGYHIIKVDNAKNKMAYQVANIVKRIEPSKETTEKAFNNARSYVQTVEGKSLKDFNAVAKKSNYINATTEALERFSPVIGQNIPNDQDAEILKWAFDKKTATQATNLFTTTNGDYIVVHLVEKFDKGLAAPSIVREMVEPILIQEKVTKLVDEQIGNGGLNAFVTKFGASKAAATVNFSNSNLANVGLEPRVVGASFGVKPNTSSKAIAGNAGVFYVIPQSQSVPTGQKGSMILENLNRQLKGKVSQTLLPSLIQAADIKDNRGRALR